MLLYYCMFILYYVRLCVFIVLYAFIIMFSRAKIFFEVEIKNFFAHFF